MTTKSEEQRENVKDKIKAARDCNLCGHTGWIINKDISDSTIYGIGTAGTARLCECQRRIKIILGEEV